jgi:hypothetical protein
VISNRLWGERADRAVAVVSFEYLRQK